MIKVYHLQRCCFSNKLRDGLIIHVAYTHHIVCVEIISFTNKVNN